MDNNILKLDTIRKINEIAKSAGNEIMAVYERDFAVYDKKDESPLTEADLASHHLIVEQLSKLNTGYPILSEESASISWQERQQWTTYWLIDPLDGTKEFIKKNGEFTVNIALIHNHQPVLGVVYAPVLDTLYYGSEVVGAWKVEAGATQTIQVATEAAQPLRIVGSRSHQSELMQGYLQRFGNYEMVAMGSSLKLCLVAEGKADLYPRLGPTSEWDTAAAHAIVKAAGGSCRVYDHETDSLKEELRYNTKESLLNPYFIVIGPDINE